MAERPWRQEGWGVIWHKGYAGKQTTPRLQLSTVEVVYLSLIIKDVVFRKPL